jgi:hypothetical protein
MPLINKNIIVRCALYVIIAVLAYGTGLIKGKLLYYSAGKLTGCNKLAVLGLGLRCVINRDNNLLAEFTDDNGEITYIIIDKLD